MLDSTALLTGNSEPPLKFRHALLQVYGLRKCPVSR